MKVLNKDDIVEEKLCTEETEKKWKKITYKVNLGNHGKYKNATAMSMFIRTSKMN